jgi:hypothetical protein
VVPAALTVQAPVLDVVDGAVHDQPVGVVIVDDGVPADTTADPFGAVVELVPSDDGGGVDADAGVDAVGAGGGPGQVLVRVPTRAGDDDVAAWQLGNAYRRAVRAAELMAAEKATTQGGTGGGSIAVELLGLESGWTAGQSEAIGRAVLAELPTTVAKVVLVRPRTVGSTQIELVGTPLHRLPIGGEGSAGSAAQQQHMTDLVVAANLSGLVPELAGSADSHRHRVFRSVLQREVAGLGEDPLRRAAYTVAWNALAFWAMSLPADDDVAWLDVAAVAGWLIEGVAESLPLEWLGTTVAAVNQTVDDLLLLGVAALLWPRALGRELPVLASATDSGGEAARTPRVSGGRDDSTGSTGLGGTVMVNLVTADDDDVIEVEEDVIGREVVASTSRRGDETIGGLGGGGEGRPSAGVGRG